MSSALTAELVALRHAGAEMPFALPGIRLADYCCEVFRITRIADIELEHRTIFPANGPARYRQRFQVGAVDTLVSWKTSIIGIRASLTD